MTLQGVVLDARNPLGRPRVADLAPFRVVRLTAFADEQVYSYARQLRMAGIKIAAVFTLEVIWSDPPTEKAAQIAANLEMDYAVLGNEPDALYNINEETGQPYDSPASDMMHEAAYGLWAGNVARGILSVKPEMALCVAGMVSGQPWAASRYIAALRRAGIQPQALDLHLYATHSTELAGKVAGYRPLGLDLCMFEWHETEADDLPAMVTAIEDCGITAATYHAWHETDIEGLHDALGRRTARYFALVGAIKEPEAVMPRWIEGHDFERYAREHDLGPPLTDEAPILTGQLSPDGLLLYLGEPVNRTVRVVVADAEPEPVPPADYTPAIDDVRGNAAGAFNVQPQGVILHGTRSGQDYDTAREYQATVNYVRNGAGGLGWHCTVGDDRLAIHLTAGNWGWNARAASSKYLAVEFAQATADREVSDAQVRAFVWWLQKRARVAWPRLPMTFPMHSELPEGVADGKSDVYPRGDVRGERLRERIAAEIRRQGG